MKSEACRPVRAGPTEDESDGHRGTAGALVPITLTRLGQDPATAASIILTTVTDVAGFLAFLGIAAALSFML